MILITSFKTVKITLYGNFMFPSYPANRQRLQKCFFGIMLNKFIKKFLLDTAFWVACAVISNMR